MNTNDLHRSACDREGEILAYLYNEATPAGRAEFESHLVWCSACTDEFAELSNARYSVFEWQREEFAPLATPRFAIPYQTKTATSWADVFRSIRSFPWPAYAMAGFLAVVLSGIGVWNLQPATDERVERPANQTVSTEPAIDRAASKITKPTVGDVRTVVPDKVQIEPPAPAAVRIATVNGRSRAGRAAKVQARNIAGNQQIAYNPKTGRPLPTLTASLDEEDESLRLADLFDSVAN